MDVRFCMAGTIRREAQIALGSILIGSAHALPGAPEIFRAFLLTLTGSKIAFFTPVFAVVRLGSQGV